MKDESKNRSCFWARPRGSERGTKGLPVDVEETAASGHAAWWRRVEFRKLARLLGIDYDAPLE